MKTRLISIIVILIINTFINISRVNAQNRWVSEWKIFDSSYIYDNHLYVSKKIGTSQITSVFVDTSGKIWLTSKDLIFSYSGDSLTSLPNKDYGKPTYIYKVLGDSKNNIWFATDVGLYKYSAAKFKLIDTKEIHNITQLAIDRTDNIWIAGKKDKKNNSSSMGIALYNGKDCIMYNSKNSKLPDNNVKILALDKKGCVWLSFEKRDIGIVKFDKSEITQYNNYDSNISSEEIRAITFDTNNNTCIGTQNSIISYSNLKWHKIYINDIFSNFIIDRTVRTLNKIELSSLLIDESGIIWIGSTCNGVFRMDGDIKNLIYTSNSPLTSDHIGEIFIDNKNRKWFITGNNFKIEPFNKSDSTKNSFKNYSGVFMLKEVNYSQLKNWKIFNSFNSLIPNKPVESICLDKTNNIWFTAAEKGIGQFHDSIWQFYSILKKGLIANEIDYLTISANGDFFAGSKIRGLYKLENNCLIHVDKEKFGYKNDRFQDIEIDNDGYLWIAHRLGVDKCKDGTCEHFDKLSGLPLNNIFKIFVDSRNRIWLSSSSGIAMYDQGKFLIFDKKDTKIGSVIYDFTESTDGNIWACSDKFLYNYDGKIWNNIKPKDDSISKFNFKCIAQDLKGNFWIGTSNNGVVCYDGSNWKQFNKNNSGIIYDRVNDILVAKDGKIWFSVEKPRQQYNYIGKNNATENPVITNIIKKSKEFDPKSAIILFDSKFQ